MGPGLTEGGVMRQSVPNVVRTRPLRLILALAGLVAGYLPASSSHLAVASNSIPNVPKLYDQKVARGRGNICRLRRLLC